MRFFGNVHVQEADDAAGSEEESEGAGGPSIHLTELRRMFDTVILAHGADRPNWLGIQGEAALAGRGVATARDLVAFYCGDPLLEENPLRAREEKQKQKEAVVRDAGTYCIYLWSPSLIQFFCFSLY